MALDIGVVGWAVLVLAAAFVGFAKTAIGGVGSIAVALFAAVLPARESTGMLLPVLLIGDLLAVGAYRRHADWGALARLFPSVAAGVLLGTAFVARVDDVVMRRTIGAVLLGLVAVHLWTRRASLGAGAEADDPEPPEAETPEAGTPEAGAPEVGTAEVGTAEAGTTEAVGVETAGRSADGGAEGGGRPGRRRHHLTAFGFGTLAGFTTMVANAGGPVMSLYLLAAGMSVLGFLGTNAWFFFLVNAFKVPFSAGLGLLTVGSLAVAAVLAPAVVVGGVIGRAVVHRIDRKRFEQLVLLSTVAVSLNLLR